MKSLKSGLIVLGSVGLLFLGACSGSSNQVKSPDSNTAATPAASQTKPTETAPKTEPAGGHSEAHQKGGQVVETGAYHLEFVPEKEAQGTHMDFYVLKGENHQSVPNAKVTAQVQTPDGGQKSLNLNYDKEGKHYTVLLPGNAAGQYQVKMLVDVDGKKVDGRFNFNK
jgi:hypothetical protein